jgi:uncharacterized repeat protein (TIGR01451 family)
VAAPVRSVPRAALAALVALALAMVGLALGAGSASAADALPGSTSATSSAAATPDCDHATAGTGPYARGICWLDLSSFKSVLAGSRSGQALTASLPGGFTMSFTLGVSGVAVRTADLPTSPSAFLGSKGNYSGIDGNPALYQRGSGRSTVTLGGIAVVDANGNPVSNYAVVSADAESTDAGESITWDSDQNLGSLIQTAGNGLGNACNGALTGLGTTEVSCSATRSTDTKTGTPILVADNPTTVSAQLVGAGTEAVAFGVLVSRVELSQTVVGAYPGDAFQVDITDSSGVDLGSDSSSTAGATSTGRVAFLSGSGPADLTLAESATSGSLANYQSSWSCTRNGNPDGTLPTGDAGSSATVSVGIGDFVNCTITETAIPAALSLSTQAAPAVDVNGDGLIDAADTIAYTFTVTNTGTLPVEHVAVVDAAAGSVTCAATTLASGDTTTCSADGPYAITAADVSAGGVHNTATATANPVGSSATVSSPVATADTATTAPTPSLSLTESATVRDVNGDFQIDLGDTIGFSFRITNTGNVSLTSASVSDPIAGSVTCALTTLAPGAQTSCTSDADYTIDQDDVDAGFVTDAATAGAVDSYGAAVTSSPVGTTTPVMHRSGLAATDQATVSDVNANGRVDSGDTIAYSVVVRNVGTVTLHGVSVSDLLTGAMTCPNGTVPPGGRVTCTATAAYSITPADVTAGQVTDTATASALDPAGAAVSASPAKVTTATG